MPTSEPTWQAAINAVQSGMSYREAKHRYGLGSVQALRLRCLGEVAVSAQRGRKPQYLTPGAEAGIVEAIHFRAKRGMCFDMPQLRHLLASVARLLHQDDPSAVPSSFPNQRYAQRFLQRHPSLSLRKAQVLDSKRFTASTVDEVESFYEELARCMAARQYAPECIWNADETGVTPQGRRPPRVICPKGQRANHVRSHDRENISILGCCSAAGTTLPPLYIFAGQNRKLEWLDGTLPGSVLAMTHSSMIQRHVFQAWLEFFVERTMAARDNGAKPTLLLLDGHFSHIDLSIVEYAEKNNIGTYIPFILKNIYLHHGQRPTFPIYWSMYTHDYLRRYIYFARTYVAFSPAVRRRAVCAIQGAPGTFHP